MKKLLEFFSSPQRKAPLAGLLALLILLPIWLWMGNWYKESLVRQERANVETQLSSLANSLVFAVNQRLALLQGLYAFTRTEWPGTDFDYPFEVFSSDLYFKSTGLSTLMIAPEGIARYVYPLYDANKLSGYDVINDPRPSVRADVQRAIHTREITLSQPGELPEGGLGMTAWRAVYRGSDLWGLVSISLDLPTVLQEAGLQNPSLGLDLSLNDNDGNSFFGSASLWQNEPAVQKINLPEGTWELGAVPAGGWENPIAPQMTIFRVGSLLIVLVLAGLVYMIVNRQQQMAHVAVLEERQRLARELHDSVSQVLYSIGLGARSARSALEKGPARADDALEYVERLAEGGQAEMRALIFELRPDSLASDGLVAALDRLAVVLKARHRIEVLTNFCPEPDLSIKNKEGFYRIAQEAANNIVKHAHASRVEMDLNNEEGRITLLVRDNGAGFDPQNEFPGHLGLRSMRERAAKMGTDLSIESAPGEGTLVRLALLQKK